MVNSKNKGNKKFGALILAAGFSSRMEDFKPLLEIGGKSLIENAITLFKNSGIDEIVTVVGYRSADLIPVVAAHCSHYVINGNYQDGMFSSIQQGVKKLKNACDAFYLLPVDIPFVSSATIKQLLDEFYKSSDTLVCYPQFRAGRGHPPLIDSCLGDEILACEGKGGMREFLRKYEDQAVAVPVDDPFILMDIDTREDLSRLKKELQKHASGPAQKIL